MAPTVELVSPAGNPEKLKAAIAYGADAVYLAARDFSLRARAGNFTFDELRRARSFTRAKNVKLYLALNVYPKNDDLRKIEEYLKVVGEIGPDALIVSDPGVIELIKKHRIDTRLHLSTQANTTNWRSASFWKGAGVDRIIAARELSLQEIAEIRKLSGCEVEVFVHGAMCLAYSGRCVLSSYMTGRSANLGDCAHPCRWKYSLVEETRPGECFPVREDENATFILSSKDLCLIEHIDKLISTGIDAFKIEGRMKSAYYVAAVTRIYRAAIDRYYAAGGAFRHDPRWLEELEKVSHREYFPGFLFPGTPENAQVKTATSYLRDYLYLGDVLADCRDGLLSVEVKNRICRRDEVEIMGPRIEDDFTDRVILIRDEDGTEIAEAHPGRKVYIKTEHRARAGFIIRKKRDNE